MPVTAVAMAPPVSIVVASVVMALRADANLLCGCDSLWRVRVGNPGAGVWYTSVSYCSGEETRTKQRAENAALKEREMINFLYSFLLLVDLFFSLLFVCVKCTSYCVTQMQDTG